MSFRRTLGFSGSLAALAAVLGPGCGEPFTSGAGGAGGGTTTTTTTTTTTSDGGQGGVGGMAEGGGGAGGMGGTGGGMNLCETDDPAACGPGLYCAAGSLTCVSCAVIGEALGFGPATPLALTSPGPDPSYPRARRVGDVEELVFSARKAPNTPDTDIALGLRDGDAWQDGVFAAGAGITTPSPEWAPLRMPVGVLVPDVVGDELILFNAFNAGGRRQIYAATPDAATKTAVPNLNDPLKDASSAAMAWELNPPRYWYMRRIGAADQL
ncbi:MAG TPA: hypothetical protein VLS89_21315, partial [Candidatus Nanopelagicales bacterium]|nr:hypothetical protein [Candidatus Nanopelagicales bacterium]